ncbi:MAG: zf-TFIIB domain-containing protein [Acidimicrobiia bacterium]|nr:zf-TFIIB domain-containing protein [Acidimicrobiia bacterium]MDH4363654.1 zf-TFIIB domain-containing protein [Acidimicrobiia bacterium]MDH5291354.1 zf-TFIIB domain-containing protein [Acidimicrobiia bacterium]
MQCPFDASELTVVNRSGIEIDWCPSCKGVWLERGELDKLIDLAGAAPQAGQPQPQPQFQPPAPAYQPAPGPAPQPAYQQPPPQRRYNDGWPDDMYDHDSSGRTHRTRRKHKRKSILGEIFDF